MKVPIEKENKDDLEVVHRQDNDSDAPAEDHEFSGCIRTLASNDLTPNNDIVHLGVVRCTSTQPNKSMIGEELQLFTHSPKLE